MIRPLRRTHYWIFLALSLLLPLVLIAALAGRAEPPVQREWPFDGRPIRTGHQP
jgi:hypothetical protein